MKKLYSNKLVILSLILPGIIVFIFAILVPICLSVYYGFTDYSGMGQAKFIGMKKCNGTSGKGTDFTLSSNTNNAFFKEIGNRYNN